MHLSINRIIWIQSPTIYLLRLVDYSFGGNAVEAFRALREGANDAYKNAKHSSPVARSSTTFKNLLQHF